MALLLLLKKRQMISSIQLHRSKRYGIDPIILAQNEQGFLREARLSDPHIFFNFMRRSPSTFYKLLSIVGPYLDKSSRREPISPGCSLQVIPLRNKDKYVCIYFLFFRLAITLRFLATSDSYPSLSYAFRGVTTVCNILRETCEILWNQ